MSVSPTNLFHILSLQVRQMSSDCHDDGLAMITKQVPLGSLILMTGFATRQIMKEVVGLRGRLR